jgi:hypothetical protein
MAGLKRPSALPPGTVASIEGRVKNTPYGAQEAQAELDIDMQMDAMRVERDAFKFVVVPYRATPT